MRERVWEAANVKLTVVTLDTDTTVHTLYGQQMGGRKSYNPKNKGKKSYQPMLTFHRRDAGIRVGRIAQWRPADGQADRTTIWRACPAALPPCVKQIFARADSGFYCWEAVQAYEEAASGSS